jgi:hypothetical protein
MDATYQTAYLSPKKATGVTGQGWDWRPLFGMKLRESQIIQSYDSARTVAILYRMITLSNYAISHENAVSGVRPSTEASDGVLYIGDTSAPHLYVNGNVEINIANKWRLFIYELPSAKSTPISIGKRVGVATVSNAVLNWDLAWAGVWNRQLTSQERTDIWNALKNDIMTQRSLSFA